MLHADLHIHTSRYSGCSNIDPISVVRQAEKVGLDIIALTEHGIRWPDQEIQALVTASGICSVRIIPGQEVACYSRNGLFQGELLVFGYPKSLGSNKSVGEIVEIVHRRGGIVIAAHPFKRNRVGEGFYGSGHAIRHWNIDGLEVEHPSYDANSREIAYMTASDSNLAAIGSSDAHDLTGVGMCRTIFSSNVHCEEDLFRQIRERSVQPVRLNAARAYEARAL